MMEGFEKLWYNAERMMAQKITVRIYAHPSFILELFISMILHCVYIFLCFEIFRILRQTVTLRPHTIHLRRTPRDQYSRDSICTSITRIQHEVCKLDVISGGGAHRRPAYSISKRSKRSLSENSRDIQWIQSGDAFKPIGEKPKNKTMMVEKLASLSPAQYVKLDKERQLRERQLKGCMHSLTTLFDNIVTRKFSETNLKEQIETAKEETVCSRVSDQVMKYLDSESVTDSLINVLNDIVEDNENPLPLKGDLTALVYDIGNLKEKSSMILDTKCDLVPSSTSISSLSKTDISESNRL